MPEVALVESRPDDTICGFDGFPLFSGFRPFRLS
jgi:hypothetical protein